jgi:hypothetical protein
MRCGSRNLARECKRLLSQSMGVAHICKNDLQSKKKKRGSELSVYILHVLAQFQNKKKMFF